MHPGNDIKNCQADPTRGTSPGEGVEIVEFPQNSKFVDYVYQNFIFKTIAYYLKRNNFYLKLFLLNSTVFEPQSKMWKK